MEKRESCGSFYAEIERLVLSCERPTEYERLFVRTQTLIQTTARAVLESMKNYREQGRRTGWIRTIIRRKKWEKGRRGRDASGKVRQMPTAELHPVDGERDPALIAEFLELRSLVRELPSKQRQVIELAFFQGLDQEEIASRLRVSEKTVYRYRLAALERLRGRLAEGGREWGADGC